LSEKLREKFERKIARKISAKNCAKNCVKIERKMLTVLAVLFSRKGTKKVSFVFVFDTWRKMATTLSSLLHLGN
jgi:hypothetical protein